ncbi:hypothetical protein [Faecalitalea cylindroides]|uniref:hypothetical protein n=1 Tax=Faecalitalea cylindroides TaxID=39483 RepID=UPI003992390C
MKCNNCGTEFFEGVFCPECGTKYTNTEKEDLVQDKTNIMNKEAEKLRALHEKNDRLVKVHELKLNLEKERLANQRLELEQLSKERENKQKLEEEKLKVELLSQENLKKDVENRTVRGTIYKTLDEAEKAKREHHSIDLLKAQLMETKSQNKRQNIFREYHEKLETVDAKNRYEALKVKVERSETIGEKIIGIYGISVLITFIISVISLSLIEGEAPFVMKFIFIWAGFGCWIWPIWKFVLFVKSRKVNYYKNLKNI